METAAPKRVYQRAWFWILWIISSILLLLMLAWYVPPRLWPEWTIEHSPFWEQKLMTIRCPDFGGMTEGELIKLRVLYRVDNFDNFVGEVYDVWSELEPSASEELLALWTKELPNASSERLFSILCLMHKINSDCDWLTVDWDKVLEAEERLLNLDSRLGQAVNFINRPNFTSFTESSKKSVLKDAKEHDKFAMVTQLSKSPILKILNSKQLDDGSWGSDVRLSALAVLNFLGAGYDHKAPSEFKKNVERGLDFLKRVDYSAVPLSDQLWASVVFGEAYAMTMDSSLKILTGACSLKTQQGLMGIKGKAMTLEEVPVIMSYQAHRAAGTTSLSGSYWSQRGIGGPSFYAPNSMDAKLAENLALKFSGMRVTDLRILVNDLQNQIESLKRPLAKEEMFRLYINHLVVFQAGGNEYRDYKDWFERFFYKIDVFSYDENGTYMNELGGAFIEADRLECAMFLGLMLSIEYRYVWIRRRSKP